MWNTVEPVDQYTEIAGRISRLPPFGSAVLKLLSISIEDDSAISSFEEGFESDPALTAELLMMANSAAFGGRAKVQSIGLAIRYLGLERVRSMAATSALRSHMHPGRDDQYLSSVWAHSIASAVAAEALGGVRGCPGLYTMGLTHDLGRLGLFLAAGQRYAAELSLDFGDIEQSNEVEQNLFGMTHCRAGALVAAAWNFPVDLTACMSLHHTMPAGEEATEARALIVTACQMADSLGFPEVPLSESPRWPELGASLEHLPQLEPEALWDEITARLTSLGR